MNGKRCSELDKVPDLVSLDKPIAEVFIAHTRQCEECFFFLTYAIAIQKALNTTNRIVRSNLCPSRLCFGERLTMAARSIKRGGVVNKKTSRDFQYATSAEVPDAIDLLIHIGECEFCHDYYDSLYDAMIAFQKKYEVALKNGESVGPVIKESFEEITYKDHAFVRPPAGQKPN